MSVGRCMLKSNTVKRCNGERGAIEAVANRRGVDVAERCVVDMGGWEEQNGKHEGQKRK